MNDVFAEEEVRYVNPFRENAVQHQHFCFGLDVYPAHVAVFEVVENGNVVALEDWQVAVEIFTLERISDDGLVLYAREIGKAVRAQGADGAFELPRRRIRGGKGEVPADVV